MGHDRLNFDFPIGASPQSMTSPCDVMVLSRISTFILADILVGPNSDIREDVSPRSVSWTKVWQRTSGIPVERYCWDIPLGKSAWNLCKVLEFAPR